MTIDGRGNFPLLRRLSLNYVGAPLKVVVVGSNNPFLLGASSQWTFRSLLIVVYYLLCYRVKEEIRYAFRSTVVPIAF